MKKILLVDDEKFVLDLLTRLIPPRINCKLFSARHGREALAVLNNEKIDAIIMDLNMPVMDGFELYKIMQNSPKLKKIPVFVVTALGADCICEKSKEYGMNTFFPKLDIFTKGEKQEEFFQILQDSLRGKS